jgi:putative ABC transport system permease protein
MNRRKLFIQLLFQSLTRRASKVALALIAVSVGTASAATLMNLTYDVESKMNRELRAYGANLIVIPKGESVSHIDEAQVKKLDHLPGTARIVGYTPFLYTTATVRHDAQEEKVILAGVAFDRARQVSPYWNIQGGWVAARDEGRSLIGSQVAQRFLMNPGDRFQISVGESEERWVKELTVSGIVSTGEAEDGQVFVSLPLVQQAARLEGKVSMVELSVLGGFAEVEQLAEQIEHSLAGVQARPLRKIAVSEGQILGKVKWMMIVLTAIILAISALCVMTTMLSLVVERQKEIALMKALGARPGEIFSLFLSEASVLALIGGFAGYAIGVVCSNLIGQRLFNSAISPRLEAIPMIMAIALIVCWSAAYAPIKRALQIEPAVVLKGE